MASQVYVNNTTLSDAAEFNRFDTAAYAMLSGVGGTGNAITATAPANYTLSSALPPVWFIATASNTAATTIAITPSGSSALTTKNVFAHGAACAGGEIVSGRLYGIAYDGTQFRLISPSTPRITASLGADVAVNNTANYFDGPSVAQGTVGTWWADGTVSFRDTAGAAAFSCKLWDGTSVIASAIVWTDTANLWKSVSLSGYLVTPAGNLRISVKDATSTSGVMGFNATGESKDSTISALRIG